ncbi:AAA family ATPase [Flammeovirga sp. MY04]|uniref:AAA family ATPase n=1 Tax=Flammeovirga sp. MY04 TaxID=1191459 RepID=UPI0008264131|nr:AAA family ATPase [Flammeovirga sp. MY04]ANQ51553.2 AAA family ATPase [Flammeovirga sp. MY04]
MKKFPIGISNFKMVIQDDYYFVDKSLLIEEVIDSNATSLLIPRPRRFGKTLNMSMLHAFFDINKAEENKSLFDNLKIKQSAAWKHQGKYPVIYLSFKDVKENSFENAINKIYDICIDWLANHNELLNADLTDLERKPFDSLFDENWNQTHLDNFLKAISKILYKVYNQKVIILIDEYDSCIIKSWEAGYYEEMISFMRGFLSGGFKDNDYLFKGIITGILRVAKESIFSGLNNLEVNSILDFNFADKFGLTEEEVQKLLSDSGISISFEEVKSWYNGYSFGECNDIYNPWSIINFAYKPTQGFRPYWVNTSANELIEELLTNANADLEKKLTGFIDGQVMECEIEETTIFKDLDAGKEKTVLGLLLFNGYLTKAYTKQEDITISHGLKIPNKEVSVVYKQMLERLLSRSTEVSESSILAALLEQDALEFEDALSKYMLTSFSFHDIQHRGSLPEKVYHAFILGLMAHLSNKFIVKSNPETGLGRADLLIYPKDNNDKRGWVLEFKKLKKSSPALNELAKEAMQQIHTSQYITTLKEHDKTEVMLVGVAFDGKEVSCVTEFLY